MQDSGEAPHLRIGLIFLFFEPVIHDSALPRVVDGIGGSNGGMEKPLAFVGS